MGGGKRSKTRDALKSASRQNREGNTLGVPTLGNMGNKAKAQTAKIYKMAGERVAET